MEGTTASTMPGGPSVGIGNYKGVMLCNRPFGGLIAAAVKASNESNGGSRPFKCGCITNETGYQYSKDPKVTNRIKKETALTRHKRWLQELQRTKEEAEEKYLSEQAELEDRKHKFSAKEAKMRSLIRKANRMRKQAAKKNQHENNEEEEEEEDRKDEGEPRRRRAWEIENDEEENNHSDDEVDTEGHQKNRGGVSRRPKWSMTEEEAMQAADREEDAEAGGLINFARGLDFERYIDDMEIRTMMEQVLRRIQTLEASKALDDADDKARAAWKSNVGQFKVGSYKDSHAGAGYDGEETGGSRDPAALSLARGVLASSDGDEIGTIHSARSVAAIVTRSMHKTKGNGEELEGVLEEDDEEDVRGGHRLTEPKIVKIDEEAGARIHGKKTPSQLPYLNRNPAI